jgi:hypothetical protein
MTSVVPLGTAGGMGAASGLLVVGSRNGSLVGADTVPRLPGRATVMAGVIGTFGPARPPTEVAIIESMRRPIRIANAAKAS